jgi:hypothetical protein
MMSTGGVTFVTQPLGNQAHQGFVSGSYGFSPTTKGTFKLAYTRGTQNENLPTASISNATNGNVPSLQGVVDTKLVQFGLSAKPMRKLNLVASLRYHDVKDKTPQYTSVRSTDNTANIALNTTPYSYKTTSGKLEGTYDLSQGYSATAGIDYDKRDRSVFRLYQPFVPVRATTDETTYRLQLRKNLSDTLNGSLAYLYSDRYGSITSRARWRGRPLCHRSIRPTGNGTSCGWRWTGLRRRRWACS